ncbi:hypothetical protein [Nocardia sp. NBC_01388]|uniref:hypothetical protein n=1 Tax=Nocardia sp. NBC_01388 TaxID=2903596 RepID=UPI00386C0D7B
MERARIEVDATTARRIVAEFLAAAVSGRTGELVRLLTDDAAIIGDGGAYFPTLNRPLVGAERIACDLRPPGPVRVLRLRERLSQLRADETVLIVGGGLTAIETATEIAEARPDLRVAMAARLKELICSGAAWSVRHPTLLVPSRRRRVVEISAAARTAAV